MSKVCFTFVLATILIFAVGCLATAETFSGSLTTSDGISGGSNPNMPGPIYGIKSMDMARIE